MRLGKRALVGWMISIFWVFLALFAIIGIMAINSAIMKKAESVAALSGERALAVYDAETEEQRVLLYVDITAKKALETSIAELGKTGGWTKSPCGSVTVEGQDVRLWQDDAKVCLPELDDVCDTVEDLFNRNMDPYLEAYPEALLPKDNYHLLLDGSLTVRGIASKNVKGNLLTKDKEAIGAYAFEPSFTTDLKYDLSGGYEAARTEAKVAWGLWKECMASGSGVNTDADDAKACKESIGKSITSAAYSSARNQYLLVFKMREANAFSNDLFLSFAIAAKDDIPPPSYLQTDIHIESEDGKKVLHWEKNKASDTDTYEIYARKDLEFGSIDDASLLSTAKESSYELVGLESGTYHVAVVAVDVRGNKDKGVQPLTVIV